MIEAAAVQPNNFTADFTIKVTGLRTTSIGDKTNVVKQVEWIMIGKEGNKIFELSQTTQLPDPSSDLFIPMTDLTENEVVNWIEISETSLLSIKNHIQLILNEEVAKSNLAITKMPWVVEETAEPVVTETI